MTTALQPGDLIPHVEIRTIDGSLFRYSTIWQHQHLLLAILLDDDASEAYAAALAGCSSAFMGYSGVIVTTRDQVDGFPQPAVLMADRWGEIVHIATASDVSGLPTASDLLDWMKYVDMRCPECEGEVK